MRKVTALIVYKRKVAVATKKVAVATFVRAKKTIQNSSLGLIEKKLQQLFPVADLDDWRHMDIPVY